MDPGIEKMMELVKRKRMSARMPPLGEVSTAVKSFLIHRERKKQPMTDNQAELVFQSLEYYWSQKPPEEEQPSEPDHALVRKLLNNGAAILGRTEKVTSAHCDLARLLYDHSMQIRGLGYKTGRNLVAYVKMLSLSGSTDKAAALVKHWETAIEDAKGGKSRKLQDAEEAVDISESDDQGNSLESCLGPAWKMILQGFVLEDNAAQVEQTLAALETRGLVGSLGITTIMIDYSVKRNSAKMVRQWWREHYKLLGQKFLRGNAEIDESSNAQMLNHVLRWCLATSELDLGHQIVRDVMTTAPPKSFWDPIFVWAAGTRKGVDEIGRMIDVMEKTNESIQDPQQWRKADIETINALVKFAVDQQDPYMAERFIALGQARNIQPDTQTFALQMDYRLGVGDVDGALIAYKALVEHRGKQVTEEDLTQDVPTINRLVVALCGTQRHDFDTIMNVTMDLADRKAEFQASTISALTLLHLGRDEHEDATDLLNTHAFHLSSTDRATVRNAVVDFELDSKTPLHRSWRTYNILRDVFDEIDREQRTRLMTSFFTRGRADMGVQVFQHMRSHSRADTIPTAETYVSAFMGLARVRELEHVEVVHNLLKLDFNVRSNTYIRNALIIAYTACDRGRKGLTFWDEIVQSKEGPNYNSIHIALRACERSPFGDLEATKLWTLLRKRNVELDQALWASYAGALVGNGDTDTAIQTIEEADEKGELAVDAFVLGSMFNGTAGSVKQNDIEAWAKERYAEEWAMLMKTEQETAPNGGLAFKIDRRVSP